MTACNLLNTSVDVPLDVEPIAAGENEVASAKRLVARMCKQYPRFFDVVVADALYMEGPFINFCLGLGKDVVVVLKNNYPSLIEDAQGLFGRMEPQHWDEDGRHIEAWDVEGFQTQTVDVPLRVLHTIETYTEKVWENGRRVEKDVVCHWWWASTIPKTRLGTKQLWKLGHSRWQIENNIFNTLGQHWSLNHCYSHDPTAMINFVLMLFVAFTLTQCFFKRHLKPQMQAVFGTLIAMTNELYAGLSRKPHTPTLRVSGAKPP